MIKQLKFVSIPVRNQDRALAFYRDMLGFKVKTDQAFNGTERWIELKIPGAETGIVLFTPQGQQDRIGGFFNGAFACDNVQKTYEELKTRGVEFLHEPKTEPWGTTVMFKDVDGNTIVLSSKC